MMFNYSELKKLYGIPYTITFAPKLTISIYLPITIGTEIYEKSKYTNVPIRKFTAFSKNVISQNKENVKKFMLYN